MATIIGLVTDKEISLLRKRGWEVDTYTRKTLPDSLQEICTIDDCDAVHKVAVIYVDRDLFEILSDSDWDVSPDYIRTSTDANYRDVAATRGVIRALLKELKGKDDSILDDLIYDCRGGDAASEINNSGFEDQIKFLIGEMGLKSAEKRIRQQLAD